MPRNTIYDTFLHYIDENGNDKLVSVSDILASGVPIYSSGDEEGDDMELVSDILVDENFDPI